MNWLRNWFRTAPSTRKPARRIRPRLEVEAPEERLVPTAVVLPHYSGMKVTSSTSAHRQSLQSDQLVLIFAGNYWTTQQGQIDQTTIANDVTTILGSPYLTGLEQYGSDGKASLFTTTDSSTGLQVVGNEPTSSALNGYVKGQLNANSALKPPASSNTQEKPLYFVINDPADSGPGPYTWGENWVVNGRHLAYVGAQTLSDGSLDMVGFTEVFSHELAEATAHAITVTDPGSLGMGDQIADNEPESAGYYFQVDGLTLQAYWSQKDKGWIVPDGNPVQKLNPIWAGNSFTGFYSDASATQPQAGTASTVVSRNALYVVTTDGALWEHTGSDYSTGWSQLINGGVTGVSVGKDSQGNDAVFINVGGTLLEHTGSNRLTGWTDIWNGGIGAISASLVQPDTVFVSYNGDLEEYQGDQPASSMWTTLDPGPVTDIQAGVDSTGAAAVFELVNGELWEYNSSGWTDIASGVTAMSASQVQADTVFFTTGSDLQEYLGSGQFTGTYTLLKSGVTAFSACVNVGTVADAFVEVNGQLKEYVGPPVSPHWYLAATEVPTTIIASQTQDNMVFTIDGRGSLEMRTGLNFKIGTTQIL
jgi:hypothetical protein